MGTNPAEVIAEARASGLTGSEASRRLLAEGPNALPEAPEPRFARRALRHLAEPLLLVLVTAAAVNGVALGHHLEAAVIGVVILLNVVVATVQETRSAAAVHALRQLAAPSARVVRDGEVRTASAVDLVRGDLLELAAGDRVPADVMLIQSVALATDESTLTGESLPVEKSVPGAGADGRDPEHCAFAGTTVVRGRGAGLVVATGASSQLGTVASSLASTTEPPLVGQLRRVAAWMSAAAIALGAAMVPLAALRAGDGADAWTSSLLAGAAVAVAAIPAGLGTVVLASLAIGARRMAEGGAIVRQLASVETMGSADVLCTDKTGTITTGHLAVADVVTASGRERDLWVAAIRCNDAVDGIGDPLELALLEAAAAHGIHDRAPRLAERPFDATTRTMATVNDASGAPVVSVKGAPEAVLDRCRPGPAADALAAAVPRLAERGLRVLAVASADGDDLDATDLEPLGLVTFRDPLRTTAVEAIRGTKEAGLHLVMVTGDHAATARSIAREAGIEGPVVAGPALDGMSRAARADTLRAAGVLARVDPATKVDLVAAHQEVGAVVAMTGDGVNDAPALRRADVGIAVLGSGGTDVAREAADVVVTSGDLRILVEAVAEGRRIRRNLRNVVAYLLTGNLSEILVVAGALLVLPELAIPLAPVQILWINLVTDSLPGLALGTERPAGPPAPRPASTELLDGRRLRELAIRAVCVAAAVLTTGVVARQWGWNHEAVRTQLLLTLVTLHLGLTWVSRGQRWTFERGWWRARAVAAAAGGAFVLHGLMACTAPGRAALDLAVLPRAGWVLAGLAGLASLVLIDALRSRPTDGPVPGPRP
jgi:Ca2+-transporting ATPase